MLGPPQAGAPQDQRRHIRADPTGSLKKPTPKPQRKGCGSSSDICRPGRRRGRKLGPACRGDYHSSAECQVSEAGVECLSAEMPEDRALLQESTEITFSSEDMEVGHPNHRRPLYLAASINQIPIKRALVDTSASVNLIPLSTLQAAGISEKKDPRMPDGSNRIRWER